MIKIPVPLIKILVPVLILILLIKFLFLFLVPVPIPIPLIKFLVPFPVPFPVPSSLIKFLVPQTKIIPLTQVMSSLRINLLVPPTKIITLTQVSPALLAMSHTCIREERSWENIKCTTKIICPCHHCNYNAASMDLRPNQHLSNPATFSVLCPMKIPCGGFVGIENLSPRKIPALGDKGILPIG